MANTIAKKRLAASGFAATYRRLSAKAMDEIRGRHKKRRGAKSSTEIIRAFRDEA